MILPDGAMELIVNLGDPHKLCSRDKYRKAYDFSTELDLRGADHADRD